MTENIEIESGKSPLVKDIRKRLAEQGVDFDSSELRMGYVRTSSGLLGDIRTAAVIAIDHDGRVAEVVHMPLEDLDPLTIDTEIIERVLEEELVDEFGLGGMTIEHVARQIIAALRAGTTKEN